MKINNIDIEKESNEWFNKAKFKSNYIADLISFQEGMKHAINLIDYECTSTINMKKIILKLDKRISDNERFLNDKNILITQKERTLLKTEISFMKEIKNDLINSIDKCNAMKI